MRINYKIFQARDNTPLGVFHTAMLTNSLLAGERFFNVLRSALEGMELYQIGFYKDSKLVALVTVSETVVNLGPLRIKMALCGNPIVSADCAIFTAEGMTRNEVLPEVLKTLNHAMDARGVDLVLLKEISAPDGLLKREGFARVPLQPILGVRMNGWRTFQEYTTDMKSGYRGKLNKAQRELERRGITVVQESNITDIADELFQLHQKVATQQPKVKSGEALTRSDLIAEHLTNLPRRRFRKLKKEFFWALKESFPGQTHVVTLRRGAEIVGCTVNLQDGETFHSIYMGLNPGTPETPYIYRSLLAAKMHAAIDRGVKFVHFGRTSVTTKADFGAVDLPEACFFRLGSKALNSIAAWAATKVIQRQTRFVARDVFKDQTEQIWSS